MVTLNLLWITIVKQKRFEPFDVEFAAWGPDGDGKQELIFASIDGSLVIIKNRAQPLYFRSPDKLPLDSMICGIDIAPIYHHDSGSPKSTANKFTSPLMVRR